MPKARVRTGTVAVLAAAFLCGHALQQHVARAADGPNRVQVIVLDVAGKPIDKAIAWALPVSGQTVPTTTPATAEMEQRDKAFIPGVLPVQVGTPVSFPNNDTVRHHVYSFSAPKTFSIKLYVGTPPEPVVFDKPGEVVLGCNIHDGMVGHVMALETPYFGRSNDDGRIVMNNLQPGEYEVKVWHPQQAGPVASQRVRVEARGAPPAELRFVSDGSAGRG